MDPAVAIHDIKHSYGSNEALRGVSFDVEPGCIFGLLGPNGGGKTTLFRIIATLVEPLAGEALIFGNGTTREPALARRSMGVVFQAPSLDKKLTARENLTHQGHLYGLSGSNLRTRIDRALDIVKLTDRAGERVEKFSGGMQRRVEVAKALLHDPKLLLLDEPSTGLDPGARRDLWDQLVALRDRLGVTSLLTTHLMEEAEKCDKVAIINKGLIVAIGTPDSLKSQIGGEVLILESDDAEKLRGLVAEKFGGEPAIVGGSVRIETAKVKEMPGPKLLVSIVESFPGLINSARIGKPTLEDVFIHSTGHRFFDSDAAPPPPKGRKH